MATYTNTIFKLLQAINFQYDEKLLYNSSQFYSVKEKRPVTIYTIKKATIEDGEMKSGSVELFSSPKKLHIVFFLRDYLYELQGQEIPTDDEIWNNAKRNYYERKNKRSDY